MLNNLLSAGGGIEVYITVSQACGLEMMALDKHGNIISYAQAPLEYNTAKREIANYDDFKNAVVEIFQMRNINPVKANVHLSLPTVWFGTKTGLPLLLDDSAITNVVIGELEQSYIFNRKEPLPFWFDALVSTNSDSRSVFYTAVQKESVEIIREIFVSLGANLVSVECSLFADLRALNVTGIATELMQDGYSWSLMIVNNSGFQMLGMQDKRILEYYEEPLPLQSYEGEEIYSAIENAAQIALMSTPSSSLVIISETDLVSAEILAGRLGFAGNTIFVEDNQFRKEPLAEMSLNIFQEDQVKVSLHSIGAVSPVAIMPVQVNFLGDGAKSGQPAVIEIQLGDGKVFELTPQKAIVFALIFLAVLLTPVGLGYYYTSNMVSVNQAKISELDNQMSQLDAGLKVYESSAGNTSFNPVDEIERVLKTNRVKIMAYAALGESIPEHLYLTYFMTGEDGLIDIKGCADSVEDVYVFFKNLKDSLVDSQLRLSKLDLKSGSLDVIVNSTSSSIDNAPYVFEITNMSEQQLSSFMDQLVKGSSGATPADASGDNGDTAADDSNNNE